MDGWSDGWMEIGVFGDNVIDYFFFFFFFFFFALFQVFGFDLAVYLLLFEVTGNRCVYYYRYSFYWERESLR
ncbi:uncharacterized protein BO87DRAFT_180895 [Aspergillus neoniger CBS 115656]|uniref:Transmembrane protein n=1 Tax=Aspergillus neoniger (strain CBS 115656) TaxID=1448310 RepID=A0A318Y5I6_ASPNB|nr:hypothetical protein BO87DRAFT_180895 [Aspergillus neoniger CBS 115656]PYH29525.1 hypothetical protein BO87DRAFT_180895 [Aspergillus neoniger CBS 115656]